MAKKSISTVEKRRKTGLIIIGVILDLLGVAMLAVVIVQMNFAANSVSTAAQIVDNKESCRIHNNDFARNEEICSYFPIFEYQVDGETYRVQSTFSDTPALYQVGEAVTIRYNPQDHAHAELDSKVSLTENPLLLLFLVGGVFFLILGAACFIGAFVPRQPKNKTA